MFKTNVLMYTCVYILYTRVEKATALSLRAEACTDLGSAGETIRLPNLSQLLVQWAYFATTLTGAFRC